MEDEYLVHYGVLGMKWGIRKKSKTSGRTSSKKKSTSKKSSRLTSEQKAKIKKAAKKTAVVAGKVAIAALLGTAGVIAINEIGNTIANYNADMGYKKWLSEEVPDRLSKVNDMIFYKNNNYGPLYDTLVRKK